MATTRLQCPAQRALAAKLMRQLRTRSQASWLPHPCNVYSVYWRAYHNVYGGNGQPAHPIGTARHYVMQHCTHMCYLAGFM